MDPVDTDPYSTLTLAEAAWLVHRHDRILRARILEPKRRLPATLVGRGYRIRVEDLASDALVELGWVVDPVRLSLLRRGLSPVSGPARHGRRGAGAEDGAGPPVTEDAEIGVGLPDPEVAEELRGKILALEEQVRAMREGLSALIALPPDDLTALARLPARERARRLAASASSGLTDGTTGASHAAALSSSARPAGGGGSTTSREAPVTFSPRPAAPPTRPLTAQGGPTYVKARADIPRGSRRPDEFARAHHVPPATLKSQIHTGRTPHHAFPTVARDGRMERWLFLQDQEDTIDYWRKNGTSYIPCKGGCPGCPADYPGLTAARTTLPSLDVSPSSSPAGKQTSMS